MKRGIIILLLNALLVFSIQAQVTYTFTNAGAQGSYGPTAAQVANAYSGTSLDGLVTSNSSFQGIQEFIVPATGLYRIQAIGATGGNQNGTNVPVGHPADISGEFELTAGTKLYILVGQHGHLGSTRPGWGGGGGTFVIQDELSSSGVPLVVAGGAGSGHTGVTVISDYQNASLTTSPNFGSQYIVGYASNGGSGAGFLVNGDVGNNATYLPVAGTTSHTIPQAFVNGGVGDVFGGGFGGGGGVTNTYGGGAGGYEGGKGPRSYPYQGGGGASFNGGTNQTNVLSDNNLYTMSHGAVIITEVNVLPPITTTAWRMNRGRGAIQFNIGNGSLGDPIAYSQMQIPSTDDPNWESAPLDGNGDIRFVESSILSTCRAQLDFTYFETYIDIPEGATVDELTVTFAQVDDGARAYIFNSAYPNGAFDGEITINNGVPVSKDYSQFAVAGERNRVVIVQFDSCPVGNNLIGANLNVNGTVVPVDNSAPPVAIAQDITVALSNDGSFTLVASQIDNGSFSANAGPVTLALDQEYVFNCADNGSTILVTLIVTDTTGEETSAIANVTVNGGLDTDADGVPNACDLDDDNDGILDALECSSEEFFWGNAPTLVNPVGGKSTSATGTINGIGYTYTSSVAFDLTNNVFAINEFPSLYGIPDQRSVRNERVSENTLTFDQPMTNPVLVFSSIGGINPVSIQFYDDFTVLFQTQAIAGGGRVDIDEIDLVNQSITAQEGYVILRFNGTFDEINFDYLDDEFYVNFAFGATLIGPCEEDTDGDGIIDSLDVDRDNDGCPDAVEGSLGFDYDAVDNEGVLTGAVDANGVPVVANGGQGVGTSANASATCECDLGIEQNEPVISVSNATINLDANGSATLSISDVLSSATDDCGIASSVLSVSNFNCDNIGSNQVTVTVTDNNGNQTSQTVNVEVIDDIGPSILTQNIAVDLDATGTTSISVSDVVVSATDVCGIADITISPAVFSCADIGNQTVTITSTDVNGNVSTATATVAVSDGVAPEAVVQGVSSSPEINNVGIIGGGSFATTLANVLNQNGYSATSYGYAVPSAATLSNIDAVFLIRTNGNPDLAQWVRDGGLLITEWSSNAWALNTENLMNATDNGYLFSYTSTPIVFTNTDNGQILADGFNGNYVNGGATEFFRGFTNIGSDVEVHANATNARNGQTYPVILGASSGSGYVLAVGSDYQDIFTSLPGSPTQTFVLNALEVEFENSSPLTFELDANGQVTITADDIDGGSSDNCGIVSRTLSRSVFTCSDLGQPVDVTLTVTDAANNSSSATASVIIVDKIAPTVVGQNYSAVLTAAGTVTITPQDVLASGSDNCGPITYTLSRSTFDVNDVLNGPVTVMLTGTDPSGNSTSVAVQVTVIDPVPVVITQNVIVYLDANGQATITPEDIDNGSNSLVGLSGLSLDITSFDCSNVGNNTVTLTATSTLGSSASGTANVFVADEIAPTITVQNATVQLDQNGYGNIQLSDILTSAIDNCGIASSTATDLSFDCSEVGDNTVTVTVTDVNGRVTQADVTVTVLDVLPIVAEADSFTLDTCEPITFTAAQLLGNDSDPYGETLKIDFVGQPSSGTIQDNGNGTYTYTPGQSTNHTATAEYLVKRDDGTIVFSGNGHFYEFVAAPGITWSAAKAAAEARTYNGQQGYLVTITSEAENNFAKSKLQGQGWIGANDSEVEGDWKWVTGPEAGTLFYRRSTGAVNGAYNNWAGGEPNNYTTSGYFVNGEDVAHFLSDGRWNDYPNDIGTSIAGYVVEYGGSSEDCNIQSTTTGTITFELNDITPPIAIAQNIIVELDPSGNASITTGMIDGGSNDACGIAGYSLSQYDFDCGDVGANTVILTVTDVNNNVSSATATVTVRDVTAAEVITQDITIDLDASGNASITTDMINNGSKDACGIAGYSLSQYDFDCSHVGTNTVTLTVTDVNNNVSSATATVIVRDVTAAEVITQDITIDLDANGNASITTDMINNGSNDACGIAGYALSQYDFDCSHVGANTVTLTVTDVNNNVSSAEATVTVRDVIAPTLTVPAAITVLNDPNVCGAVIDIGMATATDNCSIASIVSDGLDFYPVGTTTVTWTATDVNGNETSATQLITVTNDIPVINGFSMPESMLINSASMYSAGFTDNNLESATWDWGDGSTSAGTIDGQTVNGIHSYSATGLYTVTLTIVDACGESATEVYTYVPIYDPNEGHITGGGFITSLPGDLTTDISAEGKSNYGFQGKYLPNGRLQGNMNFHLNSAGFKFKSGSAQWMVIMDDNAIMKGVGTINDIGGYSYVATMVDIDVNNRAPNDRFRIKIYETSTGNVIYDNESGVALDVETLEQIDKGTVVIHRGGKGKADNSATTSTTGTGSDDSGTDDSSKGKGKKKAEVDTPVVGIEAFPNPTSSISTIRFSSNMDGKAMVGVFDMTGVQIATLYEGEVVADQNVEVEFNASRVASGVYLVRVNTNGYIRNLKLMVKK